MQTIGWLDTVRQDLRYAIRGFVKSPGFTAVALISLALGIGANTAIFSVVHAVLINPYPYANPYEIWAPSIQSVKGGRGRVSHWVSEFEEMRKVPAFADVMATGNMSVLMTGDRAPESFRGVLLSGNAFQFLGVPPVAGRTIMPSDILSTGEAEPVVVLSYLLWQRLFDGDSNAIGKTLILNDQPHTVIGVMPPRFGWWGNDSFWLPLPTRSDRDQMVFTILRLKPGIAKGIGEQQLQSLHQRLAGEKPENFPKEGFTTQLTNYMDVTVASGDMKASLRLLFWAVGFLLLIACANVANLQLARATTRSREIAVRLAIGADRRRLLRQLLTESVALSLIGGVLGIMVALAAIRWIAALMPEFYVPNEARITVNSPVLFFSFAVSVLTGIVFGLVPAVQGSRPELTGALKDATRGAGVRPASQYTRSLLVVAEIAFSVILLVGASLTIRSFVALYQIDLGFQADRVLMLGLPLPPKRYPKIEQRNAFAQDLIERVKNLPGVQAAAMGNGGLPFGGPETPYSIEGRPRTETQRLTLGLISPDYTRTLGIPLRRGRALTEQEVARAEHVALINEAASGLWPDGEDPIGKRMSLEILARSGGGEPLSLSAGNPYVMVVGIIGNTRNFGPKREPMPAAYIPYTLLAPTQRTLAVRTSGAPQSLLSAVREQVRAIDKDQPISRPITVEEVVGFQTIQQRFIMALFGSFALVGLSLAMAGIYSVLSYHVTRKTHELGVRMALGAERGHVFRLMLRVGGRLVAVGLGVGLLVSFWLTRFLQSELFQVSPTDPISILGVAILLSGAAFMACLIPARRAARLDPLVALRHE